MSVSQTKWLSPKGLIIAASLILIIPMLGLALYLNSTDREQQYISQLKTVDASESILALLSTVETDLKYCQVNQCNIEKIQGDAILLKLAINEMRNLLGSENKIQNLTGANSYDLLSISLHSFIETQEYLPLLKDIDEQADRINMIHDRAETLLESESKEQTFLVYTVTALSIALSLALFYLAIYRIQFNQNRQHYTQKQIQAKLISIAKNIKRWNKEDFENTLHDTNLSAIERKIYSKVTHMLNDIEAKQNQMDLYGSLYSMIGYEIRSITNTVKGGVKVLTKDTDEDGVVLAREITSATDTLEGLAENFNRLFISDEVNVENTIDMHNLIADLSVSLSSKTRRNGGFLECYFDNNIPPSIYGNHIGVFWMFLLQFSNAISTHAGRKTLMLCSCSSSDNIDKVQISFELIFTADFDRNLDNFVDQPWQHLKNEQSFSANVAHQLLQGISDFDIAWFKSETDTKLRVELNVTPHSYPDNKRLLANKRFLICGASPLQVDIITRTLSFYHADVVQVSTPSDVFRSLSEAKSYDAFFITDTIPGIQLKSFCKTLKSRLNKQDGSAKLFLSVSDPEVIEDVYEQVDHIFYRPSDTRSFINKVERLLISDDASEDSNNDTVLVVDDDETQLFILGEMLYDYDIESETVTSGEKAIEIYQARKPSVIFMDCIMPGIGGIEATRRIRRLEKESGEEVPITIIGATALSGTKELKSCIDAGMDYVISKPYKDDEVYRLLKKYMAVRKLN